MPSKKIVILISGEGSNLQAFIDAQKNNQLDAEIALVISNKPQAKGLKRAADAGIKTSVIDNKNYANSIEFDQALSQTIDECQPDFILLAGFMRILGSTFVTKYHAKLVNIHPSLLPKHTGLNTHQRVLQAGDNEHGCSIHFVTEQLDGGPLLAQAKIAVNQEDTEQTLAHRVRQLEHKLYLKTANLLLANKIKLVNNRVFYNDKPMDDYIDI